MEEVCKNQGWNVITAEKGKIALEILKKHHFDIILIDIQIPEMSGIDLAKIIRKNEKNTGKHIPIIATTAYAMNDAKEKCLNAGMDDYFSKPIDIVK